jgi:diacylglycerol kinase family enzyme
VKRCAHIIFNVVAGNRRAHDARREVEAWVRTLGESGIRGRLTTVPGGGVAPAVQEAVDGRPDLIVVAGGDGTIATAAGVLVRAAAEPGNDVPPLAILPTGTRNHFARDLGIPDLETAARVIATGHVVRVDLAAANDRIFINNASLGVYPRLVEDRTRREERVAHGRAGRLLRALLTIRSAAAILPGLRLIRVDLDLDGRPVHARTPFVFIGNNPYEARLLAAPHRPRLDRGLLEVVVAREARARVLVELAIRSAFGRLYQADEVESRPARTARLTRPGWHRFPLALDGEVVEVLNPVSFRVLRGALRILAPPPEWGETVAAPESAPALPS